jgi:hypothetical protein
MESSYHLKNPGASQLLKRWVEDFDDLQLVGMIKFRVHIVNWWDRSMKFYQGSDG